MIQDPVGGTREELPHALAGRAPAAGRGFLQARVSMITDKQRVRKALAEVNILLRIFPELRTPRGRRSGKSAQLLPRRRDRPDSYCLQCGRFIPGRTGENQVCLVCRLEDGPGLQFGLTQAGLPQFGRRRSL